MVNVVYDSSGSLVSTDSSDDSHLYNPGDISWTLTSTALVWIMIPGVAFVYSGLLRRKNALSMLYLGAMTFMVVALQWVIWGYSLVYSETGGPYIGNLKYFGLRGVLERPAITNQKIPSIVFCIYQLMFAAFTPAIAVGAVAERARLGPLLVFVFCWSTVVYDPIAHWIWNPHGWSYKMGSLDFAGGTPVHIVSGASGLAISRYLRRRRDIVLGGDNYPPNNMSHVYLGTALMWFGWFGFNGGSALSANLRAAQAIIVTNVAASAGGLTYMFWEYYRHRRWSVLGLCSGVVDGLVAITPAAGYVGAPAAILFGVVAATACNFATGIAVILKTDDALEIFATHGVGGITGNLLTALFAQASVAKFDGVTNIRGGFLDRNFRQLGYQIADSVASLAYAFIVTTIILWIMHCVPCLRLRADKNSKIQIDGMDAIEIAECICDYGHGPTDNPPSTVSNTHSAGANQGPSSAEPNTRATATNPSSTGPNNPTESIQMITMDTA